MAPPPVLGVQTDAQRTRRSKIELPQLVLHRVQLLAVRQPGGGNDLRVLVRHREREAAVRPLTVEQDGAGAALPVVQPFLGLVTPSRSRGASSKVVRVSTVSRCAIPSTRGLISASMRAPPRNSAGTDRHAAYPVAGDTEGEVAPHHIGRYISLSGLMEDSPELRYRMESSHYPK